MGKVRKDSKGRILKKGECQRSDGTYMYRYTDSVNEVRPAIYARTLPELRKKIEELEEQKKICKVSKGMTVQDLYEKRMQVAELRERTRMGQEGRWRKYIEPEFGKKFVAEVQPSDVKVFVSRLLGRGLSVATVKSITSLLGSCFELAVEDGVLAINPARIKVKRKRNRTEKSVKALSVKQQEALLRFVREDYRYRDLEPMLTVMLGTGLRIGEVLGLRWENVDMEKRLITVDHQVVYLNGNTGVCSITPVKTQNSNRRIPMLPEVREAFCRIKEVYALLGRSCKQPVDGVDDFVFLNRNGKVYRSQTIWERLQELQKKYNLQIQSEEERILRLTPHMLRHTCCTRMIEKGVSLKVLQYIMGHATIEITLDVYTHLVSEQHIIDELQKMV